MTAQKYDLAVAYRIYPKVSKTPPVFSDNKLKLSELCLRSFKKSLGGLRVKMWVLLDNCPSEYEELFKAYFEADDLVLVRLPGVGGRETFKQQIAILTTQTDSEIVYFAEDDYFYLPDQFKYLVNFIKGNQDADFVSPYDHRDYYDLDLHEYPSDIRVFGNRHWRAASCTTLSFLTTRGNLKKAESAIKTYTRGNYDSSLWMGLTKYGVFDLFALGRYLVSDRRNFLRIAKAWGFCWRQILFGRRWKLWVPIPSIATHMESGRLAPTIDWKKAMSEEIAEINSI